MGASVQNVAVIGASDNPERYSYKAFKMLQENGHKVFLVHPKLKSIDGLPVAARIEDLPERMDTITLYVSAEISSSLLNSLLRARPKRVIFNPGAENSVLEDQLKGAGIVTLNACTLVLLRTSQF